MFDFSQLQGLFGNSGVPQQNYDGLFQQMSGRYGGLPQTPLQGMGLQSPFMTERPQQALPTQGYTPTRTNVMGPNAMAMMGMNPNMPNMVGPTSALPAGMQPQPSQLKMWGMEDQMANPAPSGQPGSGGQNPQQPQQPQQFYHPTEGNVYGPLGPVKSQDMADFYYQILMNPGQG